MFIRIMHLVHGGPMNPQSKLLGLVRDRIRLKHWLGTDTIPADMKQSTVIIAVGNGDRVMFNPFVGHALEVSGL